MRIGVNDRWVGQAVDLRDTTVGTARLGQAIRDSAQPFVDCAPPSAIHTHVGTIRAGMDLDVRDALVAAGHSLRIESPFAAELARIEDRLASLHPDGPDLRQARKRAASAGASVDALRERVARLGGRLNAVREAGEPSDDAAASFRAATRELSEAETDAVAARQALAAVERDARDARDSRAERLSLVDRRENRRREARSWLVERMLPRLDTALRALPVDAAVADRSDPDAVRGPTRHLALGLARVARVRAPIVLVDSPFDSALRARAALDAPVVLK